MSLTESSTESAAAAANLSYVQWGAVFAGAAVAGAVSFVLISFGSGIGLAVAPLAPSWRAPSVLLAGLSGFWVLVIAVGAMAAGGYIAGRMRSTWHVAHTDEVEFRDGVHGLVVWALAVALGAMLSAVAATALLAGAAGAGAADTRANTGASIPLVYEVDRLFRSNVGFVVAPAPIREQAGQLLTAAITEPSFSNNDRAQLIGMVAATTGLTPDAAQVRVGQSLASARAKITAARHAAIILAFVTAASLFAAAAASWEAACIGGRHRDSAAPPSLARRKRARAVDEATNSIRAN